MVADIATRPPALPHPPRRVPFIGDVVGVHASTPVQDSIALAETLGPIFERVVMGRQFVIVAGADLAGELCDENRFVKHVAPAVEGLRSVGGDGLFTACSGPRSPQARCVAITTSWCRSPRNSSPDGSRDRPSTSPPT